jgi:phage shock protein A
MRHTSRHEGARLPHQRVAADLLAQWREVERAIAEAGADPDALETLRSEATRLRDAYQDQVKAALRANRPEPPPFPHEG